MTPPTFTAKAMVAGVAGRPIRHSLSPELHNAWIAAAGLDAVYVPFSPTEQGFCALANGFRGGAICGLNVTLPFKEDALRVADVASDLVRAAGAANLLLFHADGQIEARNTDGEGLLYAFRTQAPWLDLLEKPIVILGAGGAARGAVATLEQVGVREIRIVNRTRAKATALAQCFDGASSWDFDRATEAFAGAGVIINATSAEIGRASLDLDFTTAAPGAVAMDMLYRPLKTRFLAQAQSQGLHIVDGLDMLIGQATPSFEALFGVRPPASVDARALLLQALEDDR